MKKQIFLIATIAAMAAASRADTYVWTGAGGDNAWMTAANWSVGGVTATRAPGVPDSEVTSGRHRKDTISEDGLARLGENVEFGEIANDNTTIDLTGLYSIGNITIKEGAPVYTFGTSSEQTLPLENGKTDRKSVV